MIYVLAGLVLIGYLPLMIIVWKRRRVNRLLSEGTHASATVRQVIYARSYTDIVHYTFTDNLTGRPYTGSLIIKRGTYKQGDSIDIYFDPNNPKRNTVRGSWSKMWVWFGLAIGLLVTFAAYKLWEMVERGEM